MIYVHVLYNIKPGMTGMQFYKELSEAKVIEKVHSNLGCITYEFSFPADGSTDKLYLFECWKDQESLDVHASQDYRKTQMALRDKYCENVTIKRLVEL